MTTDLSKWPLGVFASIDAGLGVQLEVAQELGVPTVHLHAPHSAGRTPARAREAAARLAKLGIRVSVVFGGFEGESYADIPTVARTVGLAPPETRAARTREMKEIADFASLLGCDAVALHLGFLPHRREDPLYGELLAVTRDICDHCRRCKQRLHLETGQEPADVLLGFLADAGCDNLFINFDPANMIMYGSGEPLAALRQVGSYVRSVHCKDAQWAAAPGQQWGQEVPLGEGDVNFLQFLGILADLGYQGPLTIEREISAEPLRQKEEIGRGIRFLNELKAKIFAS